MDEDEEVDVSKQTHVGSSVTGSGHQIATSSSAHQPAGSLAASASSAPAKCSPLLVPEAILSPDKCVLEDDIQGHCDA